MCVGPAVSRWSPRGSILFGIGKNWKLSIVKAVFLATMGVLLKLHFENILLKCIIYRLAVKARNLLDFVYIHMQKKDL